MRVVVDASFAGAWLLPDEASARADRLLRRALSSKVELCVPQLWIYEIGNLLISAERRNRITADQVHEAQALIEAVPRTTFDHQTLLARERISSLAMRHRLSTYDAAYLELADRLQCELATLDKRLAKASSRSPSR